MLTYHLSFSSYWMHYNYLHVYLPPSVDNVHQNTHMYLHQFFTQHLSEDFSWAPSTSAQEGIPQVHTSGLNAWNFIDARKESLNRHCFKRKKKSNKQKSQRNGFLMPRRVPTPPRIESRLFCRDRLNAEVCHYLLLLYRRIYQLLHLAAIVLLIVLNFGSGGIKRILPSSQMDL